ncbi:MAG: hypothetical protein MUO19_04200 [Dehalococcoidales bacterium]|nr:hypothetical protein [Dehalococcoidales bacterium]
MAAISTETSVQDPAPEQVKFRWKYIALPLSMLACAVVLTAVFYSMLPEDVSYRFQESAADTFISRNAMIAWLIIPHILFTLISFGLIKTLLLSSRYWSDEGSLISRVLPLLGNMTGLVQTIIVFAALQIFLYNAYEVLLTPFWVFAVVIMVLGGVILGIAFARIFRESRRRHPKPVQE